MHQRHSRPWSSANVATILAGAAAAIGVLAAAPIPRQSTDFARLLAQYRGAGADRAVRELASWTEDRESRDAPHFSRETAARDPWAAAAQAALHLESGLTRWRFQVDRPVVAFHLGQAIVEPLVTVARQTGDARLLGFCRDWYVAANTTMRQPRGHYVPFELGPNGLESPRRQLGDDPEILTLLGSVAAAFIGPEELEGSYVHPLRHAKTLFAGGWYSRVYARDGEEYFRKALARDPEFAEARLRLGRVLQVTGHPTAHAELARAAAGSDNVVAYLAHLFLGQGHDLTGRPAEAQAAYRAAIARYPGGTVARLALSQSLFQSWQIRPLPGRQAAAFSCPTRWTRSAILGPRFPSTTSGSKTTDLPGSAYRSPAPRGPVCPPARRSPGSCTLSRWSACGRRRCPPPAPQRFGHVSRPSASKPWSPTGITPVPGLTPRDFVITDNGVPQALERVTTTWGLHVALVVDTSRSVWPAATWRQVADAAAAVVRALTPRRPAVGAHGLRTVHPAGTRSPARSHPARAHPSEGCGPEGGVHRPLGRGVCRHGPRGRRAGPRTRHRHFRWRGHRQLV